MRERLGLRPQKEPEGEGCRCPPPSPAPHAPNTPGGQRRLGSRELPQAELLLLLGLLPGRDRLPGRLGRGPGPGRLGKGWGRPESLRRDRGAEEGGGALPTSPRPRLQKPKMRFGSGSPRPYCWGKAWGTLEGKGGSSGWVSPRDPIA